jgi:tRNA threonylcarbamoyladenosine biosynthesis protein TsaE
MITKKMHLVFEAKNEQDTDRFGMALAQVLPPGAVVALVGTLGAGKTRLVQAVAQAVGINPSEVVSPTFVLVHEYQVPGAKVPAPPVSMIFHLDAYRIRDDDEFRELGPEEYYESNGWTFVEWADRVADCLPRDCFTIDIAVTGPDARRFTLSHSGIDAAVTALVLELSGKTP